MSKIHNHKLKFNLRHLPIAIGCAIAAGAFAASPEFVILHTNDTHSQIDPTEKDEGGILRRKVLIDSIRKAHDNVILVDAGDMVQGTLYFSLFGGEVEQKMMNALGYDIQILGNHEFDNGVDSLGWLYRGLNAKKLSTNYNLAGTALDSLLQKSAIINAGANKVGFIAINVDPAGIIDSLKSKGVVYLDAITEANREAARLKQCDSVDYVVAITHIGYADLPGTDDKELIEASTDIDLVIGGHSHTLINPADSLSPANIIMNAAGQPVHVAQLGKSGRYLGEIIVNTATGEITQKAIHVDKRLDPLITEADSALLAPYRHHVDSVMSIVIGHAGAPFEADTPGIVNLLSDFVLEKGREMSGQPVDFAVMNIGGIRCDMPQGEITKGLIMNMLPFDNKINVISLPGSEVQKAFDLMTRINRFGVSGNVSLTSDKQNDGYTRALIDGKPLDPDKTYTIATIDYITRGGDYMEPFTHSTLLNRSDRILYLDFIDYIADGPYKGKPLMPDNTPRISKTTVSAER